MAVTATVGGGVNIRFCKPDDKNFIATQCGTEWLSMSFDNRQLNTINEQLARQDTHDSMSDLEEYWYRYFRQIVATYDSTDRKLKHYPDEILVFLLERYKLEH